MFPLQMENQLEHQMENDWEARIVQFFLLKQGFSYNFLGMVYSW